MPDQNLFPWLLLDPDLDDWSAPPNDDILEAAQAIRENFSTVIGQLDLEAIHERASIGRNSSFAILREALACAAVRRQGRSLAEPASVLGLDRHPAITPTIEHALLTNERRDVERLLETTPCSSYHSVHDLLASSNYRSLLRDRVRSFEIKSLRDRQWLEVFEPFCRLEVVDIYETFILKPLTQRNCNIEQTGIYWLLDNMNRRAAEANTRQRVNILGTFRNNGNHGIRRPGEPSTDDLLNNLYRNLRLLVERFDKLRLSIGVVDNEKGKEPGKTPHDRFWLARSGNVTVRVLMVSNSVIQMADRNAVTEPFTISLSSSGEQCRHLERLWLTARKRVVREFLSS